jgi:hypothetical protein
MYPRSSAEVWAHVQGIVADLGFRTEKNDKKRQVLVTNWRNYDGPQLPAAAALGLRGRDEPVRLQLHLAVAPNREPARIRVRAGEEYGPIELTLQRARPRAMRGILLDSGGTPVPDTKVVL